MGRRLEWTRLWVIVLEWLDTVQTIALLPLSWFVIPNLSSVIDVLVNVVAVSVLAKLDWTMKPWRCSQSPSSLC
jgi:hypothetical protein